MARPDAYYDVINAADTHLSIPDLAKVVADYWFDYTMAAQWVVKHRPVYMIVPTLHTAPAYVSIVGIDEANVRIKVDHCSDFLWAGESTTCIGNYSELYNLRETLNHTDSTSFFLTCQIGTGSEYASRLFEMIRADIDSVMCGDIYVPPKLPIPWPPTYEDLQKVF